MKKMLSVILMISILVFSAVLYQKSQMQATYVGLPTVPCLDPTEPIKVSYTFWIHIVVRGQDYPISSSLGHDYAHCLHDIYVNDASGKVYVKANDAEIFTLGQFFDVWKKTFTKMQMGNYILPPGDAIEVFVNGKAVSTYRGTILHANDRIEIQYK